MVIDWNKYIRDNKLREAMEKSNITIEDISRIEEDYTKNTHHLKTDMYGIIQKIDNIDIFKNKNIKFRVKSIERVVEKVIKKKLNINNYRGKIKDLIGIRILYLLDEEIDLIMDGVLKEFKLSIIELKILGSQKKSENKLFKKYVAQKPIYEVNTDYEAIHITIKYGEHIGEIQIRSLFMEGRGELDHRMIYGNNTHKNNIIEQTMLTLKDLSKTAQKLAENINGIEKEIVVKEKIKKDSNINRVYKYLYEPSDRSLWVGNSLSAGNLKSSIKTDLESATSRFNVRNYTSTINLEPINRPITGSRFSSSRLNPKPSTITDSVWLKPDSGMNNISNNILLENNQNEIKDNDNNEEDEITRLS